MKNVDKTIDAICKWIQGELKFDLSHEKSDVAEMIKALAELVSARGISVTHHVSGHQ